MIDIPQRVYGGAFVRRPGTSGDGAEPLREWAYAGVVAFARALAAVTALLVGVPLVIVGLALVGPVGWIAAAVVRPLATLGVILWLGRDRPEDGPSRREPD